MDQRLASAGLLYLPPSNDHDDDTLGQAEVNWFGSPSCSRHLPTRRT